MSRVLPLLILLIIAAAVLSNCGRKGPGPPDLDRVERLSVQNQELRDQNRELQELQQQTLSELRSARQASQRADTALRSSYIALAPLTGTLTILGAGLTSLVVLALRRRRRAE